MKRGGRIKKVTDGLAYIVGRASLAFAGRLPYRLTPLFGSLIGQLVFFVLHGKHKRIAYKNMDTVFQEGLPWWRKRLMLAVSFQEFGRNLFLLMNAKKAVRHTESLYEVRGFERIEPYVQQGKGFIGVSLHMGLFMLICQKLRRLGLGVTYLIRAPKNKRMAERMFHYMTPFGISYVPDKPKPASVAGLLKALREGRMVVMMTDIKHNPKEGVWSEFLGVECVSYAGPAVLAKRVGCPVVPFVVTRERRHYAIHFLEPIQAGPSLSVESIVKLYEERLGRFVVEHPTQWWWLHDRFRYKRLEQGPQKAGAPA